MANRIEGKVAFVTGAASGIGAATARLFVEEGASVVLADMNADAGQALASELGPRASFERLDVSSKDSWAAAMQGATSRLNRLDILVNSAGISGADYQTIESIELEEWQKVFSVNLTGTMLGCQEAISHMKRFGNGGSIVNLSSIIGVRSSGTRLAYGSSKAGVQHLSESVAIHCGTSGYNIRCNSVHPGAVDTPILNPNVVQTGLGHDATMKMMGKYQVLNRVAQPREMATVILFLASDDASFVTGSALIADGGFRHIFSDTLSIAD